MFCPSFNRKAVRQGKKDVESLMIIFLDTETTGLHPGQICQLSYIMQEKDKIKAKNFFFTVDYVEPSAYAVHGFSTGDLFTLSNGKRFSDFVDSIEQDFLTADVIVCHNTAFDFSFLRQEFLSAGKIFAPKGEFCSMKNGVCVCKLQRKLGNGYKYPKLSELCEHFEISDNEILKTCAKLFNEKAGYHDARFDATALFLAVCAGVKSGDYQSDMLKNLLTRE